MFSPSVRSPLTVLQAHVAAEAPPPRRKGPSPSHGAAVCTTHALACAACTATRRVNSAASASLHHWRGGASINVAHIAR